MHSNLAIYSLLFTCIFLCRNWGESVANTLVWRGYDQSVKTRTNSKQSKINFYHSNIVVTESLTSFFFSIIRQFQELESTFKEAYSQSLSNKDHIQVLEKRIDETTVDNNQLREELASTKKQYEKLRKLIQVIASSGESPHGSPSMKRMNSSRELSRLREQAADALKLRDKLHRVQEDVSFSLSLSIFLSHSSSHTHPAYMYANLFTKVYTCNIPHVCRIPTWPVTYWTFCWSKRRPISVSMIAFRCLNSSTRPWRRRREHYWVRWTNCSNRTRTFWSGHWRAKTKPWRRREYSSNKKYNMYHVPYSRDQEGHYIDMGNFRKVQSYINCSFHGWAATFREIRPTK